MKFPALDFLIAMIKEQEFHQKNLFIFTLFCTCNGRHGLFSGLIAMMHYFQFLARCVNSVVSNAFTTKIKCN